MYVNMYVMCNIYKGMKCGFVDIWECVEIFRLKYELVWKVFGTV